MAEVSYYYNQLNKEQQKAYYAMLEGLKRLDSSFPVRKLSGKELSEIYFMIRMDHPEIFYSTSFTYRFYPDSEFVELIPEYMFEKKKIKEQQQALETRIKKLTAAAAKLDEAGKELYIHDFICQNVTYDKLKKAYSHEIIGSLGHGVGVCEGIAKTVKVLCDHLGIWCIVALSEANPEKGIRYRHAWNVLKLQGKYYHVDATFDNSLSEKTEIRYDYLNLNDKHFFQDHEPVIYRIPRCEDGDHTYYRDKKLSFTKLEDVRKRIAQAVKKGRILTFHWRGGYLTREVLQEIFTIIREEAEVKQKHGIVSVNWPQAVIRVRFEDNIEENQIIMQEQSLTELY